MTVHSIVVILDGLIGVAGIWGGAMEPIYTTQSFAQAIVAAVAPGVRRGCVP